MPRKETPLGTGDSPLLEFAARLRALRTAAGGPPYRELAERAHYSISTLSSAASGLRLPTLAVTLAYVRACEGDVAEWENRWRRTALLLDGRELDGREPDRRQRQAGPGQPVPYAGLRPFREEDAEWFFGRERLVADLADRLDAHRCVVLLGASGSGKSSLLRAGLAPRLRPTATPLVLTPGPHPLEECAIHLAARTGSTPGALYDDLRADPANLGRALRQTAVRDGTPVVLIVDQFEEVFTLCRDAPERAAFIGALTEAVNGGCRVVLGVRADFDAQCAPAGAARVRLGPMSPDELRRVVVEPARRAGLTVEGALLATLTAQAYGRSGTLPLLSHALRETWHRRRGTLLTLAALESAGGIEGALARSAEEFYTALDDTERTAARHLLLRLTAPGEGTEDTGRRITRTELDADDVTEAVLEQAAAARLISLDGDRVEIVHEALIAAWPRLRSWLTTDRDRRRAHHALTLAAEAWETAGRDPSTLHRGPHLNAARRLTAPEDTGFLSGGAGSNSGKAGLGSGEAGLGSGGVGLGSGGVGFRSGMAGLSSGGAGLGSGGVGLGSGGAGSNSGKAGLGSGEAGLGSGGVGLGSGGVGFRSGMAGSSSGGVGFRSGMAGLSSGEAGLGSGGARFGSGGVGFRSGEAGSSSGEAWFGADGAEFGSGEAGFRSDDAGGPLSDTAAPDTAAPDTAGSDTAGSSPGGPGAPALNSRERAFLQASLAAEAAEIRTAARGARRLRALAALLCLMTVLACVATALSVRAGAEVARRRDDAVALNAAAEAIRAYAAEPALAVQLALVAHRLRPARPTRDALLSTLMTTWTAHRAEAYALDVSADGTLLAVAGRDRTVSLWTLRDPRHPTRAGTLRGHTDAVYAVAFHPRRPLLATAGADGTVRLWGEDPKNDHPRNDHPRNDHPRNDHPRNAAPRTLAPATDHTILTDPHTTLHSLTFSHDGHLLADAGEDGTVRIRALDDLHHPTLLHAHTDPVRALAFSADGRLLATAGQDGTVRLWDLADPARPVPRASWRAHELGVFRLEFHPRERVLASGGGGRESVRLWDVGDPARPRRTAGLVGHEDVVGHLSFSPDGRSLATASDDRSVRIWDLAGIPRETAVLTGYPTAVMGVRYTPDGRTLVTGVFDGTARLTATDFREAVSRACESVETPLSRAAWGRRLPGLPYRPPCGRGA